MRQRWRWILAGVLVGGAGACALALSGSKVYLGRPCLESRRPSLAEVDHIPWDVLLHKYVNDLNLVDYGGWKAHASDILALDEYLNRIGCVDLSKESRKEARLAFWINAYNAVTVRGILREYPTSTIRNFTPRLLGYNIWKDLLLWVDGNSLSLDDIEHNILRKMGEPRIHFAIVCASRGCPPLREQAYTVAELSRQLTDNACLFFARPANFRADEASRTVYLSELLKWYGTDFAPTPAEQLKVLRPYFPEPDKLGWIEQPGVVVAFLEYDWGLNDQHPVGR
jgi:hypothetical protein